MNFIDDSEDLIFDMDPLVADESSVSSYYSISNTSVSSSLSLESLGSGGKDEKKPHAKICDIADILNLESFEEENRLTGSEQHDKNFWIFFEQQISYNNNDDCDSIVRCLRTKAQENQTLGFEKSKVDLCDLVKGSKQLSPSDYNRSLYNRPIAFEKDSRLWARNLLHTFKTGNSVPTSNNDNSKNQIENILSDSNSSIYNDNSFEANVEYIQKLNDENNYSAYLNYLQSNRSKLWYTLTDSLDVIDGLLGKIVSF